MRRLILGAMLIGFALALAVPADASGGSGVSGHGKNNQHPVVRTSPKGKR